LKHVARSSLFIEIPAATNFLLESKGCVPLTHFYRLSPDSSCNSSEKSHFLRARRGEHWASEIRQVHVNI
jgi:hypothetical protein